MKTRAPSYAFFLLTCLGLAGCESQVYGQMSGGPTLPRHRPDHAGLRPLVEMRPVASPSPIASPSPSASPSPEPSPSPAAIAKPKASPIEVCSFNIQFLGNSSRRDNAALAQLMKEEGCAIVVVQELVAPPSDEYLARNKHFAFPENPDFDGTGARFTFPNGDEIVEQPKVTRFFEAMEAAGFADFLLSEEDTGPSAYHTNGSASEWFVTFYRSDLVKPALDLPHGFIHELRVGTRKKTGREFERTPYAFPFRTLDDGFDFVLVSVHLMPGGGGKETARRREELTGIRRWISANADHASRERDFLILGDMNIESRFELAGSALPIGPWRSLNEACVATNTNVKSPKPYDQVFYDAEATTELELPRTGNFHVVDLLEKMSDDWARANPDLPYPGDRKGYKHDAFRAAYSDHHPVRFTLLAPASDDD